MSAEDMGQGGRKSAPARGECECRDLEIRGKGGQDCKSRRGRVAGGEGGEAGRGQIIRVLLGHVEDSAFYAGSVRKPLEGFQQRIALTHV